MKTNREVVPAAAVQPKQQSKHSLLLRAIFLFVVWIAANSLARNSWAQDDFYPIPQRQGNFGFPYPPASADEPGVTFNRRYLLGGEPGLRFAPRTQDEIWLVSSREVQDKPCNGQDSYQQLVCKHPVGTAWNRVPINQLLDVQHRHSEIPTVVFIHGNRTPAFWSRRRGKQAYQAMVGPRGDMLSNCNLPVEQPATRFIIWSWPSDPIDGPFKDFAEKSERTRIDGRLFGNFLNQLADGPIVIVSYSLGTQIAFDGIEALSRPIVPENQDPKVHSQSFGRSVQLISMAPVTRCDWPDCPDQIPIVASNVQHLNLLRNEKDLALKAFDIYCRAKGEKTCQAAVDRLVMAHGMANQVDVSEQVGSEHSILNYVTLPIVRHKLADLLSGVSEK